MTDVGEDATITTQTSPARTLVIGVGDTSYVVEPADAPIVIGREFPAQVQIADPRISRTHARLHAGPRGWTVEDHSSNGIYLRGARQQSVSIGDGLTLHLGNADGIAVTFALRAPDAPGTPDVDEGDEGDFDGDDDLTEHSDVTDPGIARAGAAVAARRRELDIAQRTLAKNKIMNAGTLIAFEKGRSWPHRSTQAKLEEVLGWEPGTIRRIRHAEEAEPETGEETEVITGTVQAPLMAEAVKVALDAIRTQIDYLPAPSSAEFGNRIGPILADLRRLEGVAGNAARSATGATDVVLTLGAVRRTYRDLMLRAAESPRSTLGQRLFAARQHAQLEAQEAANAAGVTKEALAAAEADEPLDASVSAALHVLLASLS